MYWDFIDLQILLNLLKIFTNYFYFFQFIMAFLYKVLFNKTNDLEDTRDYEDEKDVEVKQEGKDKKI